MTLRSFPIGGNGDDWSTSRHQLLRQTLVKDARENLNSQKGQPKSTIGEL